MNYRFNQYINDRARATELLNQGSLNREEREELSNLHQMLASNPPSVKLTTSKNNLPKENKERSMGGRRSIKKLKSKKKQNKKRRKTTRRVRVKSGGHLGENLRHYHLQVKTPTGKTIELSELFAESGKAIVKAIGDEDKEIDIKSQTIGDLKQKIFDSEKGYNWDNTLNKSKPSWIMGTNFNLNDINDAKPFTLFWKDKALLNDKIKLRDIIVDGERLPLYRHSKEIEPIVIKLDGTFDRSSIVETEVIKNERFKDTPDE